MLENIIGYKLFALDRNTFSKLYHSYLQQVVLIVQLF